MSLYYKNVEIDQVGFYFPDVGPADQVSLQGMFVVEDMTLNRVLDVIDALDEMIPKIYGTVDVPYSLCVRAKHGCNWIEFTTTYELSEDVLRDSELGVYEYLKYRYGDHVSLKEWEQERPSEDAYDTL